MWPPLQGREGKQDVGRMKNVACQRPHVNIIVGTHNNGISFLKCGVIICEWHYYTCNRSISGRHNALDTRGHAPPPSFVVANVGTYRIPSFQQWPLRRKSESIWSDCGRRQPSPTYSCGVPDAAWWGWRGSPKGPYRWARRVMQKASNYPGAHWSSKPICVQCWDFLSTCRSINPMRWPFSRWN